MMIQRIAMFRIYATTCLAVAQKTSVESERQTLIDMAESWNELAQLLEAHMDEHEGEEITADDLELPEWH
jgi:hypothetical protein